MKNYKYLPFLTCLVLLFACDIEDDLKQDLIDDYPVEPEPDPVPDASVGTLDFSRFVALGASITAGFEDGTLYTNGQENSFPGMLAQQFQLDGLNGAEYAFPDVASTAGRNTTDGKGRIVLVLDYDCEGNPGVIYEEGDPNAFAAYEGDKSVINNYGVSGMKLEDLDDDALASRNPYWARFATDPGNASMLDDALATNPTFFTLWVGGNDVLGYASSGGTDGSATVDPDALGASLGASLGRLVGAGAKGVVINIPPMIIAPYFQAVAWNSIPMSADDAAATNSSPALAAYNAGLVQMRDGGAIDDDELAARTISFSEGANGCVILDKELTDLTGINPDMVSLRQTTANDIILLTAAGVLGNLSDENDPTSVYGVGTPLEDKFVLTPAEQVNVVTMRATVNGVIKGAIAATNEAVGADVIQMYDVRPLMVDATGISADLATALAMGDIVSSADEVFGTVQQGLPYDPDYSPYGFFSNDGIHLNPRGHAILTNGIIGVLNDKFGAVIPEVQVKDYRSSYFIPVNADCP